MKIPFNKPCVTGKEIVYIKDVLERQKLSGDGYYTKKASEFIEEKFSAGKTLLTTSCSSALDMSAVLLNLKEGDEVILPSYTFVSTVNSIMLQKAKPVFADIDPRTFNISPEEIERKITPYTKAVFVVHYAGVACDMDKILKIARKCKLSVVEDAAQGVNAKYKDKYLGTIGDIGCYSFHETKNYTCGEGGAIIINNKDLIERAEIIREKGTNRSKFYRGEVDKYTWVDIGSSYLPSELNAAYLTAQFDELETINENRKNAFEYYYSELLKLQEEEIIRLPYIPEYSTPNYHMFYIVVEDKQEKDKLINYLKVKGISSVFHYVPLHTSPMGIKLGNKAGELPVTEDLSERIIRLPMYYGLSKADIDYIINNIYGFYNNYNVLEYGV